MIASRQEVSTSLHGAWLLARLDRSGMALFDRSETGFWHSFTAALLVYPAFLILLGLQIDDAEWASSGVLRILLVETIGYVIAWTAFPLIMLPVTRFLGREARWLDLMIAWNWSQVLQYALLLLAIIVAGSGALAEPLAYGIILAAFVATLLYEWFIARVVLDTNVAGAILIVLVEQVFGKIITLIAGWLH